MKLIIRYLAGCVVLLIGVLAVSYMQNRFDEADVKKALKAVELKFPEARSCQAQIRSRFRGEVEVRCENQIWVVDVVRGKIEK